ncbi:MAG: CDP-diacylglycerol--glycerol-3-phosphate 3-phosphatidyltransferase [Sandaracinaceae bacterium]
MAIRGALRSLPNLLTLLRIALIPLVLWLVWLGTPRASFWGAMVYALSAITDFVDGWLARRWGEVSLLGAFLDPLADKLLVMALLVLLVDLGRAPAWAVIVILARELAVTSLRAIAMSQGLSLAARASGKEKTAVQMVALLMLIVHFPYDVRFGFATVRADFHLVGLALLYVAVLLSVVSGADYVRHVLVAARSGPERGPTDGAG